MSGKPNSGHQAGAAGGGGEEQIDFSKVIIVGVVSLVLFALCTLWAVRILDSETGRLHEKQGEGRKATEIGKTEIGIVDQVPFDTDHRIEKWRQAHSDALNSYGWVDRKRGIVHIPIDKAMEQIAAGAVPAPPLPAAGGVK